ncbi:hypothetical protein MTR62_17635 [Novosphingobium sp. 1949]|uniref:Calcium-binding protein n=1 Tax=Novosphingobium organovorum TaxID=2930092 RepID=A0ABT0BHG0_9SPHN|nr:hypothetical protein [Novosphingobium organovorum]MCJ2184498.1 hypothetical protein [Novosphingobium organovorum]
MDLGTQTHFGQGWGTGLLAALEELGVDAIRDSIPWAQVETRRGTYDFTIAKASWLDAALDAGLAVSLTFAQTNPLYDKGYTVYTDAGRAAFAQFVVATLKAYPNVSAIEIGNEYNSNSFVTGPILKASAQLRDDYYAKLLAAVDDALDAAGIAVEIVGGATHSIPVDYYADLAELGALDHLDAISIHPYTTEPEQFADQIALLRSVVGEDIAIRVTEFGDQFESLADAPAYLAKMIAVMGDAGIASASWYALAKQAWYTNMELWEQDSGTASPAGDTFAFLEPLVQNGAAITRVDSASSIYFYTLGDNAALVWGTARAMTLGAGVEVYDLAGNRLSGFDGTLSFDTPVVLVAAGGFDPASVHFGTSAVIADSYTDFDLGATLGSTDAAQGWSYFAQSGTGKLVELVTMGGGMSSGELWTPYLGASWLRPLRVTATSIAPVDFSGGTKASARYEVVERYTFDEAGTFTLSGHYDVADASDDGVFLTVLVDGRAIYSAHIYDTANGNVLDFALEHLSFAAGDTVDFVVSSGANAKNDATERRIQIVSEAAADTDVALSARSAGHAVTLDYSGAKGAVKLDLAAGSARVDGKAEAAEGADAIGSRYADTLWGDGAANRLEGGAGNDRLYGRAGDDTLLGGAGKDRLDGGAGADTLAGGEGNDRYYVDDALDVVVEEAGGGVDRVYASVSYALADNVEQLIVQGRKDLWATGNAQANVLVGNAGDNTLTGGGGADRMTGGKGADSFVFDTLEASSACDVITDFVSGVDTLALSRAVFAALDGFALGELADFGVTGSALDTLLHYDARARTLYYDADGEGGEAGIALVRFTSDVSLAAGDVILI